MMTHEHKYFIHEVRTAFEPVVPPVEPITDEAATVCEYIKAHDLYERVEYAVLGCNCGSVIKQRVKQAKESRG